MSVAIIVNPLSGGASPAEGRRRAELASAVLVSAGEDGDVLVTDRRGHGRELAAAAVRRGARVVIAWGGDGTVNEIASALVGSVASLGIVPSGSGNGLARELGIARRPDRAIRDAIGAMPRAIDVGEIGGQLFVNMAGIGFDAHVAACFDRDPSGRRGLSTYARLTAREMWSYPSAAYQMGDRRLTSALLVTFANSGQFGNGACVAPAARVDDGVLDVVVFEERSRLGAIATIPRLFTRSFDRAPGVTTWQIERATIDSEQPMTFHVDGEPRQGGTHLDVCVHPLALRVSVRP
jgi:YegS/Rv2252/BmrU family lipid kinase